MDPWSDQDLELDRLAAERERKRRHASRGPTRIVLPRKARLPHRDEMARTIATMRELAEFVGELRAGLEIPQARLAARAGVSRQWLVALEQGRPTLEAGKGAGHPGSARLRDHADALHPAAAVDAAGDAGGGAAAGDGGARGATAAQRAAHASPSRADWHRMRKESGWIWGEESRSRSQACAPGLKPDLSFIMQQGFAGKLPRPCCTA